MSDKQLLDKFHREIKLSLQVSIMCSLLNLYLHYLNRKTLHRYPY